MGFDMKINLNINDYCIDKVRNIILKKYAAENETKIDIEDTIKKEIFQLPETLKNEMKPYVIYKMSSGATGDKNIDSSTCSIAVLSFGEAYEKIYAKMLKYGREDELTIIQDIHLLLIDELIKEFKKLYCRLHRRYIKNIVMIDCKNPDNKEKMLKLIKQFDVYKMISIKSNNIKDKNKKNNVEKEISENESFEKDSSDKSNITNDCLCDRLNEIYEQLISSQIVVFYAILTENPDGFSLLM